MTSEPPWPRFVTRFAPSPTGRLHAGHAYAAAFAHALGARFLLRLEDIDPGRCRTEYAGAILRDVRWLGLPWHGRVRRQSRHMAQYRAALDALIERGLAYPCFCSRADIARQSAAIGHAPHEPDGAPVYPGTCRTLPRGEQARRLAAGLPCAWRLHCAAAIARITTPLTYEELGSGVIRCEPERFGDVILGRRDLQASYHFCVTHDDAQQGVTLVTRAEDLRPSTHLHRLLQALHGWPAPIYAHHAVATDAAGARLSKRSGAPPLALLREQGADPATLTEAAQAAAAARRTRSG